MCSRRLGRGKEDSEDTGAFAFSFSFSFPWAACPFLFSSFTLLSLPGGGTSELLLAVLSMGDCGWLDAGLRGPFSDAKAGEGGRVFFTMWLVIGLGWGAVEDEDEPLVGVEALLELLARAASAALALFCLLSSAARLLLNVRVLGERLEGREREREWRWRLRERERRDDVYGLRDRDFPGRLEQQRWVLTWSALNSFYSQLLMISCVTDVQLSKKK